MAVGKLEKLLAADGPARQARAYPTAALPAALPIRYPTTRAGAAGDGHDPPNAPTAGGTIGCRGHPVFVLEEIRRLSRGLCAVFSSPTPPQPTPGVFGGETLSGPAGAWGRPTPAPAPPTSGPVDRRAPGPSPSSSRRDLSRLYHAWVAGAGQVLRCSSSAPSARPPPAAAITGGSEPKGIPSTPSCHLFPTREFPKCHIPITVMGFKSQHGLGQEGGKGERGPLFSLHFLK